MSTILYTTRPGYTGFTGTVKVDEDRTLDVDAELAAGGGEIEVDADDFPLVAALDHYPALYRVGEVPDDPPPANITRPAFIRGHGSYTLNLEGAATDDLITVEADGSIGPRAPGFAVIDSQKTMEAWQEYTPTDPGESFAYQEPGDLSATFTRVLGVATRRLKLVSGLMVAQADIGEPISSTITLTGTVTGGTFTLSCNGLATTGIAYNATAATVQAALEALSNIADAGAQLSVTGPAGGPWVVTHVPGTVIPLLAINTAGLTGTTPGGTWILSYWSLAFGVIRRPLPAANAALLDTFPGVTAGVALEAGPNGSRWTKLGQPIVGAADAGLEPPDQFGNGRSYIRSDFTMGDSTIDLHVKAQFGTASPEFHGIRFKGDGTDRNALECRINPETANRGVGLSIRTLINGSYTVLASTALTTSDISDGVKDVWLRCSIAGNFITHGIYTADPATGATAVKTITTTLAGSNATTFGAGVTGRAGFVVVIQKIAGNLAARLLGIRFSAPRQPAPIPLLTKTSEPFRQGTSAKGGEPVVALRPWYFDNRPISTPDLDAGDVLTLVGTRSGTPPNLVRPYFAAMCR